MKYRFNWELAAVAFGVCFILQTPTDKMTFIASSLGGLVSGLLVGFVLAIPKEN